MIYTIRTTSGREGIVMDMVASKVRAEGLNIQTIFHPAEIKGYIFIEGTLGNVQKAIQGVMHIRGLIQKPVRLEEIQQFLEYKKERIKVELNDIVEIIGGPFKAEKGKVNRVDKVKGEVTVELLEATIPIPVTIATEFVKVLKSAATAPPEEKPEAPPEEKEELSELEKLTAPEEKKEEPSELEKLTAEEPEPPAEEPKEEAPAEEKPEEPSELEKLTAPEEEAPEEAPKEEPTPVEELPETLAELTEQEKKEEAEEPEEKPPEEAPAEPAPEEPVPEPPAEEAPPAPPEEKKEEKDKKKEENEE